MCPICENKNKYIEAVVYALFNEKPNTYDIDSVCPEHSAWLKQKLDKWAMTTMKHQSKQMCPCGKITAHSEYYTAVNDALICWKMTATGDAKTDLNNLICQELAVALNPAVSLDARVLQQKVAAEIVKYIEDQGTIEIADGGEQCYYIIDDDLKTIREKFGVAQI